MYVHVGPVSGFSICACGFWPVGNKSWLPVGEFYDGRNLRGIHISMCILIIAYYMTISKGVLAWVSAVHGDVALLYFRRLFSTAILGR